MEYDKKEWPCTVSEMNENPYHNEENIYFWDLGFTKLVGDENHPHSNITGYASYNLVVSKDGEDFTDLEETEDSVNIFIGDFVTYVETDFHNCGYLLNEDENNLYKVKDKSYQVDLSNLGDFGKTDELVLVETVKAHSGYSPKILTKETCQELTPITIID